MSEFSTSIQLIIAKLGYDNSSNLFYSDDISTNNKFSLHTIKILKELKPFAFYCVNNKPFILFYDQINDSNIIKELNRKIWNAQVPVTIFCDESSIKIYNGSSLNFEQISLELISQQPIKECNEFSPFSYWRITSQDFWNEFAQNYSSKKLNELLLDNIGYITDDLKKKFGIKFATKLVLRLIFIRYLVDRRVDLDYGNFSNNVEQSQMEFLEIVKSKQSLYSLFSHLKQKFNGNLFDLGNEIKDLKLTPEVFTLLFDFLSGKIVLTSGQLSLFSMYDFNIIPVELISNIYEILLGKEAQQNDKAFYTPSYLVDYILNESVSPYLYSHDQFKVLDPACGSGIFLVECFRRIVEKNIPKNGYFEDDFKLQKLLTSNIYGVDINEDAVDVTIFSLYLTILDYKDPKTLMKYKLPNLKNTNLIVSDFFEDEKLTSLKNISFDFIIGNPPWGSIKKGKHLQYCKEYNKPQQNSEISRSFIYKVEEYSHSNTQCCLVLPSKLFYNNKLPAQKFRKLFLTSTTINKIIELSSVRKLVFKNADAPAAIVMFKYNNLNALKNRMIHIALKPNIFFKLFNIIVIEKNDIKFIEQDLLFNNDWAWKTIVYGTSWDLDIIKRLQSKFPTIKDVLTKETPKLLRGAGVEDQDGDQNDATHLLGKPLLDSKEGINHFFINANKTKVFNKSKVHRPRNPRLFQPPYCLITKGVDCDNYKMRAAYSEEEFITKNTIYSVKGLAAQKNILLNLTGLFNSSFYAYLNLMLGSSIGIEREQRFIKEVFQFPYAYSDSIPKKVSCIQDLKSSMEFGIGDKVEDEIEELDDLILRLFGLEGNSFVDYALNVQIPQITTSPNQNTFRSVNRSDLQRYANYFQECFESVYQRDNKYIKITLYPEVVKRFTVFELVICNEPPEEKMVVSQNIDTSKELLTRFSIFKTNDLFYQIRDIVYFEESSFFIIKTNEYKNWHPAIAQIDLSEIIDEILSGNGGDQ